MSTIINSLLNYFPTIKEFYDISSQAYSLISGALEAGSRAMDCDVYFPNAQETLLKTPDAQRLINNIQSRGFDVTPILEDDVILQNAEVAVINQRINEQFQEKLNNNGIDLSTFTASDIRNITDDVTRPCPPVLLPEDEESIEQLERLKEAVKKEILEDDQFMEFIDKCRTKDRLPDALKEIDKFTLEEIKEVAKDCFEGTDIPNELDSGLDGLSDQLSDLSETTDPDSGDFSIPESFTLTQDATQTLLTALGEKGDCFSVMNEMMEELKTITNEYTEHIIQKPELEKEYVYSRIYYNMLRGIKDGILSKDLLGSVFTSSRINLYDKSIKDYSSEISREEVIITSKIDSSVKYRIGELIINTVNNPDDGDGEYFTPYFKMAKIFKKDRFKNGEAEQEEYEKIESDKNKELLLDVELYSNIVRRESKQHGAKIYRTLSSLALLLPGDTNDYVNELLDILDKYLETQEARYTEAEEKYFSFEDKTQEFIDKIKEMSEQMEKTAQDLGCEPPSIREADVDEEFEDDFRGLPDPSKPTLYDKDYWKKFSKLATQVGLIPIPQFFGSNDFKVNVANTSNPQIKLPGGGIAIDEDGIPRFLFWPIGLLIPTPISPDGLYRIPLPAIWNYIFMFTVEDPLRKLFEKMVEYKSKLDGFDELRKYITPQDTLDRVWQAMPRGSLDSLLSIMGLNNQGPLVIINQLIGKFVQELETQISVGIEDLITSWDIDSDDWDYNKAVRDLDQVIANKRNSLQSWVDENLNSVKDEMNEILSKLNIGENIAIVQDFITQVQAIVNSAKTIMDSLVSCFNLPNQDGLSENSDVLNEYLNKAKQYSSYEFDPRSFIGFPEFRLPYLSLSDYLFVLKDTITTELLRELQSGFSVYKLFPKLKFFTDQLTGSIKRYYQRYMKMIFFDIGFDPRIIINLEIPKEFIANFSLLKFSFPELVFVFFLAQSGIFPYPYLLAINSSNTPVPGVINARTIEFLLTIDIKNPIKVIKENYGSNTVPLKTQIETILNQSLGIYYNPLLKIPINLCSIPDIQFPYQEIIAKFFPTLNPLFEFAKAFLKKGLNNSLDFPNPDMICQLMNSKNNKERLDIMLGEVKLDGSSIIPKASKLKGLSRYGLSDFSGDLKIDGLKSTFDVNQFTKIDDVLNIPDSLKVDFLFNQLGTASKVIVDLLPQLTIKAPYIQDDLPAWERLKLSNIPFVFFLAEFLVAAKRGSKLPIPEFIPALEI